MNKMKIEVLTSIFTVDSGKIKVLLVRKKNEPYKGYWTLPNRILNNETIEDNVDMILNEYIGISNIYLEQNYTFSSIDRVPDDRVIAVSYICVADSTMIKLKQEVDADVNWFSIDEIPKLAFDYKEILDKSIIKLRSRLINTSVLKCLFPSDFTLPELQCVYEFLLEKKLDRRNFRKKFIVLDLIEDTGYKNEGGSGRPAKLYKFKDNIKDTNLF